MPVTISQITAYLQRNPQAAIPPTQLVNSSCNETQAKIVARYVKQNILKRSKQCQ